MPRHTRSPAPRVLAITGAVLALLVCAAPAQSQQLCDDPWSCDPFPPGLWITPANGTRVTSSAVEVSVGACDDRDISYVALYGPSGFLAITYGQGWGCATLSATTALQVGANALSAQACDVTWNCAWSSVTIYYDPPPPPPSYGIAVTPDGESAGSVYALWSGTVAFVVKNAGAAGGHTTVSCPRNAAITDCWIITGNGQWLAPSTTATVSVGFVVAAMPGISAAIVARACFTESPGTCDEGRVYVGIVPAPVARLVVTPAATALLPRQSVQLVATPYDAAGHALDARLITYRSSAPEIASVSATGFLTALRPGAATLTVSCEGVEQTSSVVVRIPVASIVLSPSSATLQVGQVVEMLARLLDADGHELGIPPGVPGVSWTSSSSAASITPGGIATARSAGTATISATLDGRSVSALISVQSEPVASALVVSTRGLNAGTSIERDECLTIAVAADAAYECGDLRLVHALPTTTTMGRARTPALIYVSGHAIGGAKISADVSYVGGVAPTELVATLRIPNRPDVAQRYSWSSACVARACRIVVPVADAGLATGVYPYTLDVRAVSDGAVLAASPFLSDSMVVVNRSRSPYGAGWWIDGVEQLLFPVEASVLWVGGDGSTRLFRRVGTSDTYSAVSLVDRPETLDYVRGEGRWRRWLRNRAYVEFDGAGRHVATVNRQGQRTTFAYWDAPASPLRTISLPVRSTAVSRVYQFDYQTLPGGEWMLASVTAPGQQGAPRVSSITRSAASALSIANIVDPHGRTTTFGTTGARIDWRQNGLGDQTTFEYDAGNALSRVSMDMLRTRGQRAAVSTRFCAAESYSRNVCATSAAPSMMASTVWDGPRVPSAEGDDTTRFWVNGRGAPTRVRNALGYETIVERADGRWPALVTRVTDPRGHIVTATYDDRGRLLQSVDVNPDSASALAPNRNATTTYEWDGAWDFVRTTRGPSGLTTTAYYDPNTGDRLWQRPGSDPVRNVRFEYDQLRQVRDVYTPLSSAPTHYDYDDYGNVRQTTTPLGFRSLSILDALGRDSVVQTPIDTAQTSWRTQRFTYDIGGRLQLSVDEGPATGAGGTEWQAVYLRNEYDPEGNLTAVHRWANPDPTAVGTISTAYTYDELGRKLTEADPYALGSPPAKWTYDEAGNVVTTTNKRNQTVTATYDLLNRARTRIIPGAYNRVTGRATDDVQRFSYDESGNLIAATNVYAEVGRGFTLNGRLAYDTLRLGAADLSAPGMRRAYAITNGHDIAGRRSWQRPPISMPGLGVTVTYGYDDVTGALAWIDDLSGARFAYGHDNAGLLSRLVMPGGLVETHEYDADGRERRRLETGTNLGTDAGLLHDDAFVRDAQGRVIAIAYLGAGMRYSGSYRYAALGTTVVAQTYAFEPEDLRFTVDAFGSVLTKRLAGNEADPGTKIFTSSYEPHSNRLAQVTGALPRDAADFLTQVHDADGNLTSASYSQRTIPPSNTAGFVDAWWSAQYGYAADGKLMTVERVTVNDNVLWINDYRTPAARSQGHGVYEEYRYDALGRRVWKRAHRRPPWFPYCAANDGNTNTDCLSAVSVTVWDGDQVLYELRAPGETSLSSYALESNLDCPACSGNPAQHFGTVFYLHGAGIDRPLELVKDGMVAVLHTTWRGQVDRTTDLAGRLSTCTWSPTTPGCIAVDWPGLETNYFSARPPDRYRYGPKSWYGDLVQNHEDASRQQYMRNRYYDPNTGRFTQEDPIGIAGGVNLYGFAGGDHVNYSDPFGLCPMCVGAALGVAEGFVLAKLLGQDYGWKDAAVDAALGATGAGIAAKLGKLAAAGRRAMSVEPRIIGHFPDYAETAEKLGAKYFHVPKPVYEVLLKEGKAWSTNQGFLDDAIKEGAEFWLATPAKKIRATSSLEREVEYLLAHGYQWNKNMTKLIPK